VMFGLVLVVLLYFTGIYTILPMSNSRLLLRLGMVLS
jgi:hypothetical protein